MRDMFRPYWYLSGRVWRIAVIGGRLFGELGVATRDSDMSFAGSCRRSGLEYSSRGASATRGWRRGRLPRSGSTRPWPSVGFAIERC